MKFFMLIVVGVSCRISYSIVNYLFVSCSESITSVGEERESYFLLLLLIMWFLFGGFSSSSLFVGSATLFCQVVALPGPSMLLQRDKCH